jgi:hypothetical protein
MKKRILVFSLALVLLLTLAFPATALAKVDKSKPVNTSFTGSGFIYIKYMPEPAIRGNVWRYYGEIVEGQMLQSSWDALSGAYFWSDHDSVVKVGKDGSARGTMWGSFSMTRPDGSGVLRGAFEGKISGNLYTGDIYDTGTWISMGGTGAFEGIIAGGKWSAELHVGLIPGTDYISLVGPIDWEGKYISPAGKPWKR